MGTVTVVERAGSRQWSMAQKGQECTVQATYLVRWIPASDVDTYPGDGTVLADTNVPKPTGRPPSSIHASNAWIKTMICRTVTYTPETSMPYAWNVQATYSSTINPYSTGVYIRMTRTAGERTFGQYRSWTSLPSNGTVSWPPSDMGGTKYDLHGTPRPRQVIQQTVQLEYLWDRTSAATGTPNEPDFVGFAQAQGTRNSDWCFGGSTSLTGYSPGTLLYKGCQATLEQECWRLVHVWLYDDFMHLEQVPCPNETGAPILMPGATFAGQQVFQTDKVGWYQRYPTLAAHMSILPADIQAEITKAYPATIP